jgi:hypothetical protein
MLYRFSGRAFPASALSGAVGAETGPDEAAQALRSILVDPRAIASLPQSGWRLLYRIEDQAEFAAWDGRQGGWASVIVRPRNKAWSFAGSSFSVGPRAHKDGCGTAEWRVDPASPRPGPDSMRIALLVTELACTGGRSAEGRLLPPDVRYTDDAATITFFVTSLPPGAYRCPGNPPTLVEVDLLEPLADHRLLDGGVSPPREATTG